MTREPYVVHVVPALFASDDGIVGGAERYVFELARHMADVVPTRLLSFGLRDRIERAGALDIRVIGDPWLVRGQRANPFALSVVAEVGRADIVHCHQQHIVSTSTAALAARLLGRRVFCTELGGGGWDLSTYISTDRLFHGHLHVSEYSRTIAGHAGNARAHVISGGVDTVMFSPAARPPCSSGPRHRWGLPSGGPSPGQDSSGAVLFVGRLLPHKGIDYLLRALPDEMAAEIVGPPADPAYLTELTRLAASKRVTFLHDCTDERLVDAYRRARCVVLPSVYSDMYGRHTNVPELLGQTLLEGMACGIPAVCTAVASLPEIVQHGITGLVVPPNDPVAFGQALAWLRDHPDRAHAMGEAGRARAVANFSWRTVVDHCIEVYGSRDLVIGRRFSVGTGLRRRKVRLKADTTEMAHPSNLSNLSNPSNQSNASNPSNPSNPSKEWHILTCEYPPQIGGVSDATFAIAGALAQAGASVHVWGPAEARTTRRVPGVVSALRRTVGPAEAGHYRKPTSVEPSQTTGVSVHRDFGAFGLHDLRAVGAALNRFPGPRRLLVHWVPHGWGWRSVNVPLALWLASRAFAAGDCVDLLVHEPFLAWSARPTRVAGAVLHRIMLAVAAFGAERVWVSTPSWIPVIRPYVSRSRAVTWLPVPAPFGVEPAGRDAANIRQQVAPDGQPVIGHFSAHSPLVAALLGPTLERLVTAGDLRVLLIGRGSDRFADRFLREHPQCAGRIHAAGHVEPPAISAHIHACDVMLQPYPDGVSARRTTMAALLAHGAAIVTGDGRLTESFWRESGAVDLAGASDPDSLASRTRALLRASARRVELGQAATRLYDRLFDVSHTVRALLDANPVCSESLEIAAG